MALAMTGATGGMQVLGDATRITITINDMDFHHRGFVEQQNGVVVVDVLFTYALVPKKTYCLKILSYFCFKLNQS